MPKGIIILAIQSDSALFTLAPLCAGQSQLLTLRGKQTSSKNIWSGGFPFLFNTFTHLHRGHRRNGLMPDSFKITCSSISLYKCMQACAWSSGCSFRWTHSTVPSDEHTPLSEIVVGLQGSKESSPPVMFCKKNTVLQVIICDESAQGEYAQ
jgi:hypothetical protein